MLTGAGWLAGRYVWGATEQRAAEHALKQYDFAEALEHLEYCLNVWPNNATLRLQAARAARRGGLLARAEEHLALCEVKGVTPESALERSLLLAQRGELQEVELLLHGLLREDHRDSVLILEALAQGYRQVPRVLDTGNALEELIKRAPAHPWAYFWRGNIYEYLSRIFLAVDDYRRAVELLPRNTEFRIRLVQGLLRSQEAAEAWPHIEELLRRCPANPDVILCAARCQRALGQHGQALEYLERLVRDQPDHAEAWAERGLAYNDKGDGAVALVCLKRAYALDPNTYAIGFAFFQELRRQGKEQEAARVLRQVEARKREDEHLTALFGRAGDPRSDPAARYEIGVILMRRKDTHAALRWFSDALRQDPSHRPTHLALADYYQRAGNTDAAAYHRSRAGQSVAP
jgi:tetratricopeptide (TPR) repeat protein